jgi:phosphomannomutase/phosphoglucomutase
MKGLNMEINPEIFRAYDIRGKAGKDLDASSMELLGQAQGTYLNSIGVSKAVVGSDNRLTSDEYRAAVIKGLNEAGIDVIDLGTCTTSITYWAQYHFDTKGAVMVTASHNPSEYNGVKLGRGLSDTLVPIEKIKELVEKKEFVKGTGKTEKADPSYIEDYYKELISKAGEIKPFKVVIDASNGTAGKFMPELLKKIGCEAVEQNCELDGSFPNGTPDPTESKIAQRLADRVVSEKADVGFSFDGDGDRLGLVDEKGGIIWNDVLVAIFSDDVIANNPGAKIVYNTLCSRIVTDVIKNAGGVPLICKTGHAFIKEMVHKENAPFGGELSGHFYFMDKFYGHDDGVYAALRVLSYLTNKKKTLSEVVNGFPKYVSSPEIKVGCSDAEKNEVIQKMAQEMKKDFPDGKVIEIDGARIDFSDGMIIARASQNGPYLTVKFEGKEQKVYDERREYIKTLLHKYPEIDWNEGVNLEVLK